MYKITMIAVLMALSACSTAPKQLEVVPADISDVYNATVLIDRQIEAILQQALEQEPLQLYFYRDIEYNIALIDGERVVHLSYDSYVKLIDLLTLLTNRIEIRERQIDDITNIRTRKQLRESRQFDIP